MLFYFLLSRFAFGDVNSDEDGFSDRESDDAGNDGNGSDARSGANNSEPVVTPQMHVPQEEATACPPGTTLGLEQANPSSISQQPDMSSITHESPMSSEQPRAAVAVTSSSAQQPPSTAAAVTEVPVSYPYLSRLEEQHHYKEEIRLANETKVICSLDLLLDVFKTCHKPGCKNDCSVKHHLVGPSVVINWTCSSGHKGRFESSRDVNEMKSNNLQTAASILLSGNNFAKIERMAKFLGLSFISESTFYRLQRLYFVPAINEWWTWQQEQIFEQFCGKEVVVCGDGQCDSPGHNAKNLCYYLMELVSGYIIELEVRDKRHVGLTSGNMEKAALQNALQRLRETLNVVEIVTDASTTIKKLIGKSNVGTLLMWKGITVLYNVW